MNNQLDAVGQGNQAGGDNVADQARSNLSQLAMTYHVCGDGRVVFNPSDCRATSALPDLEITGLTQNS